MAKKLLSVPAGDAAIMSLAAIGSGVLTTQVPELLLSTSNTGWEGYLANLATGVGVTIAASRFLGPKAASGALIGSLVVLIDRVLSDQFSGLGQYLSPSGLAGVRNSRGFGRMQTVRDGYYFHPALIDNAGTIITPAPVLRASVQAVVQAYPQLAAPIAQAMLQGQ